MVTDYDDIIERLTKRNEFEVNLKDVFNEDDLKEAIKKSFADDDRRKVLERNTGDLFDTAKVKDKVVENSIKKINESLDLEGLEVNVGNITVNIGDVSKKNELKIQKVQEEVETELTSEAIANSKKPSELITELAEKRGKSRADIISEDIEVILSSNERLKGLGASINRQQIIDAKLTSLQSIEKFSNKLGISEDEGRDVLVREEFTLFKDGERFKQ